MAQSPEPPVIDVRSDVPIEDAGPNDLTNQYMTTREERAIEVQTAEMRDWAIAQDKVAIRKKSPDPQIAEHALDPFPTDRGAPAEQSTAGAVMRNVAEMPRAAALGVDSAIRNATGWAVDPLVDWLNANVANLDVPVQNPQTPTGEITKSVTEFLTGFIPALKGLKALGVSGAIAGPFGASVIADFTTKNPLEARLADLWKKFELPENVLTDYLASDPTDAVMEGRFKNAVESVITGFAAEGILLGARSIRAWKSLKVVKDGEDQALVEKYGQLTDEDFARVAGDPAAPLTQTQVPVAGSRIPREPTLTPEGRAIETGFANRIEGNLDKAIDEYAKMPGTKGGRVINTDIARELEPAYLKDRTQSAAVHEPASWLVKQMYQRKLAQAPAEGLEPVVLFTAGGTGAGKSSAIDTIPNIKEVADTAQIIYDTNMAGFTSAKQKIEQALDADKTVVIALVVREPDDALRKGALTRAMKQEAKYGSGRTVPLEEHVKTHVESIKTVKRLAQEYADTKRVRILAIDNTRGAGNAVEIDLAQVKDLSYDSVVKKVSKALEEERAAGRISEAVYGGFKGKVSGPAAPAGGAEVLGQDRGIPGAKPQPQGARGSAARAGTQQQAAQEVAAGKLDQAQKLTQEALPADLTGGYGVVDVGEMKTYINFSRIGGPDDVKAVIADTAEKFRGSIVEAQRGVITHRETAAMADELGMSVQDLLQRRRGQPLNAEEATAARKIWQASGEVLLNAARKASDPNAGPLDQYAFRKAMATHHAIQAEVMGARTETARALSAWRITATGGIERARAVDQLISAMGGPQASQEMARRLAILAEHGEPGAVAKFVEKGFAAKSFDALREVWVNGLLSSPATHVVNTMSNAVVAFQSILERQVASAVGTLTTEGGAAVPPGEAMAMTFGLISGIKDAFRMAWKGFSTGQSGWALNKIDLPMERAVSAEAFKISSETGLGRTIDMLGEAARIPGRLLGAEDEFFKSIGYRMELHAQALRMATAEGLKGPALAKRFDEIMLNPPENIRIASTDAALYQTFTDKPGAIGQAFLNLRERVPAISFILPFIKTPVNIARYTFERTPFAPLVAQWRDDIAAGGARADLALARMGTGTTILLAAADYADSGLITGRGPKDPGEREAMLRQGWQPYSMKVGDRFYSYNRADPIGAMLGFAADSAEAIRHGEMNQDDVDEWQELMATGIAAVSQVAINKTYLRGVSEFINVMADPTRYGERYINNMAASFVPFTALAGAVERAVDPTVRETDNPWESINAKLAGLSDQLPPRLTLWGEEVRAESGLGKGYDFFSPIQSRQVKPEPIDAEIMRLAPLAAQDNVDGSAPTRIAKRTNFSGVQVNFKQWPKVYEEYVRLAGNELKHPAWRQGAKDFLNAVVEGKSQMSPVYNFRSDEMKIVFIKQMISQYRALAQYQIMNDPKFADFAEHVRTLQTQKRDARMPVLQ